MTTPAALALILANNTHKIANHQQAGQIYTDIHHTITTIETTINRPILPRLVGPCPTFNPDGNQCLQELRAKPDTKHVKCPKCKVTHQKIDVTREYLRRNRNRLFTLTQLEAILTEIDEPVSGRTLRRWRKNAQLKPRGYWRPDGHRGTMRRNDADVPGFWIDDARKLRSESTRIQGTTIWLT